MCCFLSFMHALQGNNYISEPEFKLVIPLRRHHSKIVLDLISVPKFWSSMISSKCSTEVPLIEMGEYWGGSSLKVSSKKTQTAEIRTFWSQSKIIHSIHPSIKVMDLQILVIAGSNRRPLLYIQSYTILKEWKREKKRLVLLRSQ